MTALQRWLLQNRAARPWRAAVSLLLVLVLVAGATGVASGTGRGDATPTAVATEGRGQQLGRAAAAGVAGATPRLLPVGSSSRPRGRWQDLRHGGLPAPRAPDA